MFTEEVTPQVNLFDVSDKSEDINAHPGVVLEKQDDGSHRAVIHGDEAHVSMLSEAAEAVQEASEASKATVSDVAKPGFTDFWNAYRAALEEAESKVSGVSRQAFGSLAVGSGLGSSMNVNYMLRQTREELIDSIYLMAERSFAPRGCKLKIERMGNEVMGGDEDFDPDRLWTLLESIYGGQAGIELGYKQIATDLVSYFGLRRKVPVRKNNRIELEQSGYAEKSVRGDWTYSYTTYEYYRKSLMALRDFCLWAGDHDTAAKVGSAGIRMGHFDHVISRERKNFGSIQVVTFLKSITFEIYGDLADKFHEFIATYGIEELSR